MVAGQDPLKLPLKITFEKEAGIDAGGLRTEYFSLIMKELFNPQYAMFKFNEDLQCYWFNGDTFEPNLNYELVGNLMGLAFYNNMFVDMPVVPVCYKLLLNLEPDLKDMAQWQPELATSLQYIINYKESENNWVKLEDIIERAFVAEKSSFGIREEVELIPGGKNMIVTSENKHEFVRLFIEYEFKKQCEQQLASFKKGFERTVDISVLQTILTPEDLDYISTNITKVANIVTTSTATFNNASFLEPSSGSQLPPTSVDNFTFFANGVNISSGSIQMG